MTIQTHVLLLVVLQVIYSAGIPVLEGTTNNVQHGVLVNNGSEAEPLEFPWQVSLRSSLQNLHLCGGVIIDQYTVLTTASCAEVVSPYQTTVVAGNIYLNMSYNETQQIVQVTSVHIHPNYAENTDHSNDIAVLKVGPAFAWTANVASIPNLHTSYLVPSVYGIISGWGTKREEEITLADKLQKATVKLMESNAECQRIVDNNANNAQPVLVEDTMICIATPSSKGLPVDTCTGDQGGPLIIYDDNDSPVLVGLISFGIGCGRPNMPSFCTRVYPFLDFISRYQESFNIV